MAQSDRTRARVHQRLGDVLLEAGLLDIEQSQAAQYQLDVSFVVWRIEMVELGAVEEVVAHPSHEGHNTHHICWVPVVAIRLPAERLIKDHLLQWWRLAQIASYLL